MRASDATITLRERSAWEATDLGLALVRRNAGLIYANWLLTSVPILILVNLVAGLLDILTWAWVVMWWLKPVFDRGVVFVISRSVFERPPGLRETLAAQWRWRGSGIWPWLLWRRFNLARSLLLPVDLLERVRGKRRRERVRVIGGASYTAHLLTFVCINLELMLELSLIGLAAMFIPLEFIKGAWNTVYGLLTGGLPWWGALLLNVVAWTAVSIMEPFYVGAGFGLYLNRRVRLEAWDIELAFRRIAARLAGSAVVVLLAAAVWFGQASRQVLAAEAGAATREPPEAALQALLGPAWNAEGSAEFARAATEAYRDRNLDTEEKARVWVPRKRSEKPVDLPDLEMPRLGRALAATFAFIFKYGLWIAAGLLLALVLVSARKWLHFGVIPRADRAEPDGAITDRALDAPEVLPADLAGSVRALMARGEPRAALALLYRSGVQALAQRLGAPLPPGATESQCLRSAAQLEGSRFPAAFAAIVRLWQSAAYAERPPGDEEIEAVLAQWQALERHTP